MQILSSVIRAIFNLRYECNAAERLERNSPPILVVAPFAEIKRRHYPDFGQTPLHPHRQGRARGELAGEVVAWAGEV